jgi:hypothetical protein
MQLYYEDRFGFDLFNLGRQGCPYSSTSETPDSCIASERRTHGLFDISRLFHKFSQRMEETQVTHSSVVQKQCSAHISRRAGKSAKFMLEKKLSYSSSPSLQNHQS